MPSVPRSLGELKARSRDTFPGQLARDLHRRYRQRPAANARRIEAIRAHWEADGRPLPAPNPLKVDEVLRYVLRFHPWVFIETGTYKGHTLRVIKDHVYQAWSIELSPELASRARVTFAEAANVEICEGDSATWLPRLLEPLYEPVLFWLDGHWSEGETAKADVETPVRAELEAILTHRVRDHVVLIDDCRHFGVGDYPSLDEIEALIRHHRPEWEVTVEADILRAHPAIGVGR